jgi:putative tryptophan/tyrosine transport system substrate-binding protein
MIPIVFQGGGDPVSLGLVASLNRPGGNVTGASNLTVPQRKAVQFLRELVPAAGSLALLLNTQVVTLLANRQVTREFYREAVARELQSQVFEASTDDDLTTAF